MNFGALSHDSPDDPLTPLTPNRLFHPVTPETAWPDPETPWSDVCRFLQLCKSPDGTPQLVKRINKILDSHEDLNEQNAILRQQNLDRFKGLTLESLQAKKALRESDAKTRFWKERTASLESRVLLLIDELSAERRRLDLYKERFAAQEEAIRVIEEFYEK